jgi:hypothetical protein
MRKVCVLVALATNASGVIAGPSAAVFWSPDYTHFVQEATHRPGLIFVGSLPPPLYVQARVCFERPAAEELIRSEGLSKDELAGLSGYDLLRTWLRSTCSLVASTRRI